MVYRVKRPDDGAIVPLTCTPEQLNHWLAQGYEIVEDSNEPVETEATGEPKKRSRKAAE